MLTRTIPRTGEALPVVGCGTYRGFDTRDARALKQLEGVIDALFASGGAVIDSSPMYGDAEDVCGAILAKRGPSTGFVATKVWTQGRTEGVRQMQRSLAYFRRECIDLMQVHNLVDVREHMATLLDWKAQGRVRYVGVTHYASAAHGAVEDAMRSFPLDFIQINYSLDDRGAERRLLPLAQELGIGVIVNYPFGGGRLIRSVAKRPLPAFAVRDGYRTWAELLLSFIVAHDAVSCVIPGTANPAHMADNLRAGEAVAEEHRANILAWWSQAAL